MHGPLVEVAVPLLDKRKAHSRAARVQELRGIGLGGYEVPEWKTKALGKAPTFGYSDVRPIKEQRESLPIFKLRDQLVEAVNTNQASAQWPGSMLLTQLITT